LDITFALVDFILPLALAVEIGHLVAAVAAPAGQEQLTEFVNPLISAP